MDISDVPFLLKNVKDHFSRSQSLSEDVMYYFMHIPKTAGTSFRYSLYDYFNTTSIYPGPIEYFVQQKAQYLNWKNSLLKLENKKKEYFRKYHN